MSPGLATTYRYRRATPGDVSANFAVLEEIAPEIPVYLDSAEQKKAALERVQGYIGSGETWVALDRADQVVGFLLAAPDDHEKFQYASGALHLPFGGVKTSLRGQYIFTALLAKMKSKGVPLTAAVSHLNKSNMFRRLEKLGFRKPSYEYRGSGDFSRDEENLRWQP